MLGCTVLVNARISKASFTKMASGLGIKHGKIPRHPPQACSRTGADIYVGALI